MSQPIHQPVVTTAHAVDLIGVHFTRAAPPTIEISNSIAEADYFAIYLRRLGGDESLSVHICDVTHYQEACQAANDLAVSIMSPSVAEESRRAKALRAFVKEAIDSEVVRVDALRRMGGDQAPAHACRGGRVAVCMLEADLL